MEQKILTPKVYKQVLSFVDLKAIGWFVIGLFKATVPRIFY